MTPTIVSRAGWEFSGWDGTTYAVDIAARDYFFNHYYGITMPEQYRRGAALPRHIDELHKRRGWVGIGYGFCVDLDGIAFEGRGWNLVGAHCPNFNTRGMSVMYAVGGDQKLTNAQKVTGRWFRDKHQSLRGGKVFNVRVHGDEYPTACAGAASVNPWVKAGMPLPGPASPIPTLPPPVVIQPPKPPPTPTFKLVVDGALGANTIRALQTRLNHAGVRGKDGRALTVDGDIGTNTTWALQKYLNSKLAGVDIKVDGLGFGDNLRESYGPTNTIKQLQRWLGTVQDGVLSYPNSLAVRRLQDRLNRGNF